MGCTIVRSVAEIDERRTTMAAMSLSPEEFLRRLLADEHADVLREGLAWLVRELMESEVAAQAAAAHWHDFGMPHEEAQALLGKGAAWWRRAERWRRQRRSCRGPRVLPRVVALGARPGPPAAAHAAPPRRERRPPRVCVKPPSARLRHPEQ